MNFSTLDAAFEWLESHVDYEKVTPGRRDIPTLQPIIDTLAAVADPHRDYASVHVTGTNGKGTTTSLVASLLGTSGLRVGTFTSPDLHAVNERIAIAGESIDDEAFANLLSRLCDVERVTGIRLTRFEILTVGAYLHFSDEGVDVAVVEVGVGGTWDSTNVIDADVSVLTNVDLDHVAILGPTIAAIAADKVGIFRPNAIAVLGTADPEVVAVAAQKCATLGTRLVAAGTDFELTRNDVAVGGRLISIRSPFATYDDVSLSLHGIHQGDNAATALVAAEMFLGRALGESVVRSTYGAARMPGRLEVISRQPLVVLDGAHNPAGMRALTAALSAFHVDGNRRLVIGMLVGREVDDMVAPLVEAGFTEFLCCEPASPRAMPARELVDSLRRHGAVAEEFRTVSAAFAQAKERSTDADLIIVAGSLYLVAEVRSHVLRIESQHR